MAVDGVAVGATVCDGGGKSACRLRIQLMEYNAAEDIVEAQWLESNMLLRPEPGHGQVRSPS